MKNLRLITFDLDDTLWAIGPTIERAERRLHEWLVEHCPRAAARYNPAALRALRIEAETLFPQFRDDISALRRESIRLALQRCDGPVRKTDEAFEVFWQARNDVAFYPDVLPALDHLKQHYTLAAISNGNACIERTGLSGHFDFGLSARETGCVKPAADIFLQACARAGVEPAETLHVGDDVDADVRGALGAGMQAAWIDRRNQKGTVLPAGVLRIETLAVLSDRLLSVRETG